MDMDSLSARLSDSIEQVISSVSRLKKLNESIDELFSCAAEFARTSRDRSQTELAAPLAADFFLGELDA